MLGCASRGTTDPIGSDILACGEQLRAADPPGTSLSTVSGQIGLELLVGSAARGETTRRLGLEYARFKRAFGPDRVRGPTRGAAEHVGQQRGGARCVLYGESAYDSPRRQWI